MYIKGDISSEALLLKIQQHMVFDEIFLFRQIHFRQGLQLLKMRPSVRIIPFYNVVTTLGEDRTNGHMHQVLLLFLGDFFLYKPRFLHPDQEQNGLQVGLFPETLH